MSQKKILVFHLVFELYEKSKWNWRFTAKSTHFSNFDPFIIFLDPKCYIPPDSVKWALQACRHQNFEKKYFWSHLKKSILWKWKKFKNGSKKFFWPKSFNKSFSYKGSLTGGIGIFLIFGNFFFFALIKNFLKKIHNFWEKFFQPKSFNKSCFYLGALPEKKCLVD